MQQQTNYVGIALGSLTLKKIGKLERNFFLLLLFTFSFSRLSAQDIIFNVKTYKGGYNISCNGSTNGAIDATIVGGVPPYTYAWSNGATTQDLVNIGAGNYTLTVTDALSHSSSKSVTLYEPDLLDAFLTPSVYKGGYNISKMGANDGSIVTEVKGGATPYSYSWSNGSHKANLDKLTAGTYSLTITDQNGCSVTKSITLLQPTPLVITSLTATTYGTYNTRCFGSKDGSINMSVSGGMPPYTYKWSNGSFDEDPSGLEAGTYKVVVFDVNGVSTDGQITLTQPSKLAVEFTLSSFTGGYNISCNGCSNGTISTVVSGGTAPFSYFWKGHGVDGVTGANLTTLGPGDYAIIVTDVNGCKTDNKTFLTEPPSTSWSRTGNTGSSGDFLGTTNNAPLVLKTASNEAMRVAENGNVGIGTNNPQNKLDVNGNADVNGTVTARQGLKFDNTNGITYSTDASGVSTFSYGRAGVLPTRSSSCAALPYVPVNHAFGGWVQIYSADAAGNYIPGNGLLNFQTWAGGSSIDASIGGTSTSGYLLLNHFCGNKTFINAGTHGGDVQICSSGNVGIGIINPTEKLDVDGNIKLNSNTLYLKTDIFHGLKFSNSFASLPMDGPVLFGFSNGMLGTTGGAGEKGVLFWNADGRVGIGNANPQSELDVTGTVRVSSLASPAGGIIQTDALGNLTTVALATAGIGFWQTINGNDIFHTTGKVGIGTNAPGDLFQVGDDKSSATIGSIAYASDINYAVSYLGFNASRQSGSWMIHDDGVHNGGAAIFSNIFGEIYFSTVPSNGATDQTKTDAEILAATKLFIDADGNVAIGTIHTDGYKFSVKGNMRAKDIIVKLTGWSDFVFDENYQRMGLLEKEAFYKKEKHLPNIGTEQLIVNEGLQVGTTMNGMMQNIEENTLDLVDLYKKFLTLEKENAQLKQENIEIQKRILQLENGSN